MKVVLVGHPGSQKVAAISKYLTGKYLPDFDVIFLNYLGQIEGWSKFVAGYLWTLKDEKIIFALDDYLVRSPIDMQRFEDALKMKSCVKLCESTQEEHIEYPVTTQYTIWNRMELISLLAKTSTPWNFEVEGSKIFQGSSILHTCIHYDTSSALSSRWSGIHLNISLEDISYLEKNGYI